MPRAYFVKRFTIEQGQRRVSYRVFALADATAYVIERAAVDGAGNESWSEAYRIARGSEGVVSMPANVLTGLLHATCGSGR